MARKKKQKKVAVIDFETDPFKFGRVPKPFAGEFHSHDETFAEWGPDCVDRLCARIEALPDEYMIFAHNGGKFDFHLMHKHIDNPMKIINGRIVKCALYQHELRDSLSIIPVALKGYQKDEIDYDWFEADQRENHKKAIMDYMHSDCVYLLDLVTAFIERFGPKLTVGSTAITELQKYHTFERMKPNDDAYFRQFYFGGRVQCFRSGVLSGPFVLYDVNSMYPHVMRDYLHPVNSSFDIGSELPDNFDKPFFARFIGRNAGALPVRTKHELTFDQTEGEFFACSHEIKAGLELGLLHIDKVIECAVATETISFAEFVDTFYKQKTDCKIAGDKIGELFAKFMLNSAYGKFGTNPENFEDWFMSRDVDDEMTLEANGYELKEEFEEFTLWARPSNVLDSSYFDVSVAASITSAARSVLLRGIHNAVDPIYCDTDSLICRSFAGDISETRLGGWKLETSAPSAAVAGRKLYALYDPERMRDKGYKPAKIATKGGRVPLEEIIRICEGAEYEYANPAPSFSVSNPVRFISRKFRKTA